jgi:hypothetical protein
VGRRTIDASDNPAVVRAARTRNNGRYNGNGRHWETPPEVFEPLHAEFAFTLDVCASASSAKVPRFFSEQEDGLSRSWGGERCWMNPPYGREVAAWTRKARVEVAAGGAPLVVGLLPASTDLAWWHEDVAGCCAPGAKPSECRGLRGQPPLADVLRWYRGRVRFLTGGPYRASGFFASVAVAWRPRPA